MPITSLVEVTFSLRCKHSEYMDFCLNMANVNNYPLLQEEAIIVTKTISQKRKLISKIKLCKEGLSIVVSICINFPMSLNHVFFTVGRRAAATSSGELVENDGFCPSCKTYGSRISL